MELEGRIISIGQKRGGVSQRTGNSWKTQEYVLEYRWYANQMEPSRMVFVVSGEDRIKEWNIQLNDEVRVRFYIDSREYQGRWYNEVKAMGITFVNGSAYKDPELMKKLEEQERAKAAQKAAEQAPVGESTGTAAQSQGTEAAPFGKSDIGGEKDGDLPF